MKKTLYTIAVLIAFSITASAQVPNNGFEDWDSTAFLDGHRLFDPVSWLSTNAEMVSIGKRQPITMSTDAHSGVYALRVTSIVDDGAQQGGLIISTKFPLTGRVKYFEGYYKYQPAVAAGTDSFRIYLKMYRNGQAYGQAFMIRGEPQSQYTYFKWDLTYPDNVPAPDSAEFIVHASIYNDSDSSELLLDDMNVGYQSTGIKEADELADMSIYPNPANDRITFLGYPPKRPYGYRIVSATGKMVAEGKLTSEAIDISTLSQGLYFVVLNDDDGNRSTFRMIKQ
jgi:hypothetical protein